MKRLSDRIASRLPHLSPAEVAEVVNATVLELHDDLTDSFLLERRVGDPQRAATYRALASDVFEQEHVY